MVVKSLQLLNQLSNENGGIIYETKTYYIRNYCRNAHLCYVAPVQAAEADDDSEIITCKVIIYEYPTEPTEISAARATSTKSVSKTVVFQNADGDVLWQVRLDATFRYNGSTSVCTAANASTQTFSSSWKTRVSSCSKSQNRAYASAYGNRYSSKGKLIETVTQNVTLTCSKTGAIS